jgi:Flp pilus assembly protein TadB
VTDSGISSRKRAIRMGGFLQAAITVVPALLAYQGGVTRSSRLRNIIREHVELLDKLPSDHPSRETITAHVELLVNMLVQRERDQFQPTSAGASVVVTTTLAVIFLVGSTVAAVEAVGWYTPEPQTPEDIWMDLAVFLAIGIGCAWYALWARRRPQPGTPAAGR